MRNFYQGALSPQDIYDWLIALRGHPRVPVSGFDVTAVFRARHGERTDYYFAGVNSENNDHRLSTHGEEGCIASMVTALGKQGEFVEGWCMGAPTHLEKDTEDELGNITGACCGKCRQQLANIARPDMPIHMLSLNGKTRTDRLDKILPNAFTFREFAPELADALQNRCSAHDNLNAHDIAHNIMRFAPISEDEAFEWLSSLESFDFTSKVSQSVLLTLDNCYVVAGTKVEEAAFVGMSAVQSALANAVAEFGTVNITNVATYSYGRDDKTLAPEQFTALPLSSIQCIGEFAKSDDITITYFNGHGQTLDVPLYETARHIPTTRDTALKKSL
jgi:cytidine deaminase